MHFAMLILQNITYFCIRFHFTSFIKELNQYTIMDIISRIIERAKANKQRIEIEEKQRVEIRMKEKVFYTFGWKLTEGVGRGKG